MALTPAPPGAVLLEAYAGRALRLYGRGGRCRAAGRLSLAGMRRR